MESINIFQRKHSDCSILPDNQYHLIIGLTYLYGFLLNLIIVNNISNEFFINTNSFLLMTLLFFSYVSGLVLFHVFNHSFVSFLGYNLIIAPLGFTLAFILSLNNLDTEYINNILHVNIIVSIIMIFIGTYFPSLLSTMKNIFLISFLSMLFIQLSFVFLFNDPFSFSKIFISTLFCLWFSWDWSKANLIPKTFDNAIDSTAASFAYIINCFVLTALYLLLLLLKVILIGLRLDFAILGAATHACIFSMRSFSFFDSGD